MKKTLLTGVAATALFTGMGIAGEIATPAVEKKSYCDCLKTIGSLYKNDQNPYIQEINVTGRVHWQAAYLDAERADGEDFSESYTTWRRVRLGGTVKAFNVLQFKGHANFAKDDDYRGGSHQFGYEDFESAEVGLNFNKAFGLDTFDKSFIKYGRFKASVGQEYHTSSKKIKTVERSAVTNKLSNGRYTGVMLEAEKGCWSGSLGYLSLDYSEFIGDWSDGEAVYASSSFDTSYGLAVFDFFINLDDLSDDEVGIGYQWAGAASLEKEIGRWDLMVVTGVGNNDSIQNERDGLFWGLVVIPSTYLIEDKLEFVSRYQYQGSDSDEGIRTNSRYFRTDRSGEDIVGSGGRGDEHHSLYAGLNYYFCGHRSKVMTGVEYETIDTGDEGAADATTLWFAYRMYF